MCMDFLAHSWGCCICKAPDKFHATSSKSVSLYRHRLSFIERFTPSNSAHWLRLSKDVFNFLGSQTISLVSNILVTYFLQSEERLDLHTSVFWVLTHGFFLGGFITANPDIHDLWLLGQGGHRIHHNSGASADWTDLGKIRPHSWCRNRPVIDQTLAYRNSLSFAFWSKLLKNRYVKLVKRILAFLPPSTVLYPNSPGCTPHSESLRYYHVPPHTQHTFGELPSFITFNRMILYGSRSILKHAIFDSRMPAEWNSFLDVILVFVCVLSPTSYSAYDHLYEIGLFTSAVLTSSRHRNPQKGVLPRSWWSDQRPSRVLIFQIYSNSSSFLKCSLESWNGWQTWIRRLWTGRQVKRTAFVLVSRCRDINYTMRQNCGLFDI